MIKPLLKEMYTKIKRKKQDAKNSFLVRNKQKIFCIGRNKTGTTSLKTAFNDLGYIVGDQRRGELLLDAYINKDYSTIFNYCKTAEVFQDVPFSYPELYKKLDGHFPNSKFILSIRSSPEVWYESLTRFHTKLFTNGQSIPTKKDLQNAKYIETGWIWKANRTLYNSPESNPYRKEDLIRHYIQYNKTVTDYFKGNDRFLKIDISEKGDYFKFCDFLSKEPVYDNFPWENKTIEIT